MGRRTQRRYLTATLLVWGVVAAHQPVAVAQEAAGSGTQDKAQASAAEPEPEAPTGSRMISLLDGMPQLQGGMEPSA